MPELRSQIYLNYKNLVMHLKVLEKWNKLNPKLVEKEIIKIKVKVKDIESR
jgi:hypothetical protein